MNGLAFNDYFSQISTDYARYRPSYPNAIFELVAQYAPSLELAWDCATGSGQGALGLSPHFRRVIATDASREQIQQATHAANVEYRVAPAESSGLESGSVDAVTVAAALHWFDRPKFYAEVRRVCRPGAVLAVWTYFGVTLSFSPAVDAVVSEVAQFLLDYWPPPYDVLSHYFGDHNAYFAALDLPFESLPTPTIQLVVNWNLQELLGLLATASAAQRCLALGAQEQLAALFDRLAQAWGQHAEKKTGTETIALRMMRIR